MDNEIYESITTTRKLTILEARDLDEALQDLFTKYKIHYMKVETKQGIDSIFIDSVNTTYRRATDGKVYNH